MERESEAQFEAAEASVDPSGYGIGPGADDAEVTLLRLDASIPAVDPNCDHCGVAAGKNHIWSLHPEDERPVW